MKCYYKKLIQLMHHTDSQVLGNQNLSGLELVGDVCSDSLKCSYFCGKQSTYWPSLEI